jgi:hypothetical protein
MGWQSKPINFNSFPLLCEGRWKHHAHHEAYCHRGTCYFATISNQRFDVFAQEIIAYAETSASSVFGTPSDFDSNSAREQHQGATQNRDWGHSSQATGGEASAEAGRPSVYDNFYDGEGSESHEVTGDSSPPASQHRNLPQHNSGGSAPGGGATDWFRDHKRKRSGGLAGGSSAPSFTTAAEMFGGLNRID